MRKANPVSTRFLLGRVVATPDALEAISDNGQLLQEFISRHRVGDWGEWDKHDRLENERSLKDDLRLLSAYRLSDGTKIWIVTEADRASTTILLPEEY